MEVDSVEGEASTDVWSVVPRTTLLLGAAIAVAAIMAVPKVVEDVRELLIVAR